MIELVEVDKKVDLILETADYEFLYRLVKDNTTIGFGTINKDKENAIYIYVEEDSRGNGYGKLLFSKILEEIKKKEIKEIKVKFYKKNIQMLKIVKGVNGLHISTNEDEVEYLIPII